MKKQTKENIVMFHAFMVFVLKFDSGSERLTQAHNSLEGAVGGSVNECEKSVKDQKS